MKKMCIRDSVQADNSPRSDYTGTGLGMPIVKQLVEKMGGTITVESKLGEGSCFTVILPFKIDTNARPEEKEDFDADISDIRVLLVEDNELNAEIAEFMLTENGAKVETVKNGLEAVQHLSLIHIFSALIAGGWIAVVIILIVVLLGCAVSLFGGGSGSNAYTPVSAEVEAYEPLIQKYAKQYGIPEYVELIKAVMMQESGGRGLDPMQAAEGSFNTRYPHEPNGIKDPEYSIECGVQELKAALISAEVENPIDMEHIKLALQGYNFGNGYISWAKTNYGGYSYANAVEFSTMQAARLGWDSYGDTQYPAHVLLYYPYGRAFTSGGNQAIVCLLYTSRCV